MLDKDTLQPLSGYPTPLPTDFSMFHPSGNESITSYQWKGFTLRSVLSICEKRLSIGTIGRSFPSELKTQLKELFMLTDKDIADKISFKDFASIELFEVYIKSTEYGQDDNHPLICFGIFFDEIDQLHFNYSLHYFDSWMDEGIEDVPTGDLDPYDAFQKGPDMESYDYYTWNGYSYVMKIINDYILKKTTRKPNAHMNCVMNPMLYDIYKEDSFGSSMGMFTSMCIIIGYMYPMCIFVYRMVNEKETKAKEGMKIMGLSEGTYFLSYFIMFFILNAIYSVAGAFVCELYFKHIPIIYLWLTFFLWGWIYSL